ncbi:hypothetical protein [Ruania halotolerans]|uniref:hypothetical protein n=1 Tax=Ruania halotolerans TaxID=2897773 RepID=UPI001E2A1D0F|nr:hypothetical protein [Ruania halotolerans]UFU05529.1 hypothetical protein LQF10_13880 [Ruania halotolerans]
MADPVPDSPTGSLPRPLRIALLIAALEAVVLVLVGVFGVVSSLQTGGLMLGTNIGMLVILMLFGAFLVTAVRALHHGRRWGRAPVITWQLIQIAVLISSFSNLPWWLTVPGIAAGIVVTICVVLPASLAATARSGQPDAMM